MQILLGQTHTAQLSGRQEDGRCAVACGGALYSYNQRRHREIKSKPALAAVLRLEKGEGSARLISHQSRAHALSPKHRHLSVWLCSFTRVHAQDDTTARSPVKEPLFPLRFDTGAG